MIKVLWLSFLMVLSTSCCTLSLTNVSTHGEASDVVDQEQKQDGTADLDATLPFM